MKAVVEHLEVPEGAVPVVTAKTSGPTAAAAATWPPLPLSTQKRTVLSGYVIVRRPGTPERCLIALIIRLHHY
jgi:hypothetical protein